VPKNFKELQDQLSQIKLWAVVAVLGVLALLAFNGYQAKVYWESRQEIQAMNYQMDQIAQSLRGTVQYNSSVQLANRTHRLQQLDGLFHHPQSDELLAMMSSTARLTRVSLGSVSTGDPGVKVIDDVNYVSQPMNLTVKGSTDDIYRFLYALHQQAPVLLVASMNLSNSEDMVGSSADINLVFYLSPQTKSDAQGED